VSGVSVSPNPIFILVTTGLASLKEAVVVYRIAEVLSLFKHVTV